MNAIPSIVSFLCPPSPEVLQISLLAFLLLCHLKLNQSQCVQSHVIFFLKYAQGFPFQMKLKSMKGKQAEIFGARSSQSEHRRCEQLGGFGGIPPGKF